LPCFKSHKVQCKSSEGCLSAASPKVASQPVDPRNAPAKGLSTDDLNHLFQEHPELKQKLQSIYKATQDPGPRERDAPFDQRWTKEKGFNSGLAVLSRELDADGAAGDDVKAFSAYIESVSRP
jgi:hypothetical protein